MRLTPPIRTFPIRWHGHLFERHVPVRDGSNGIRQPLHDCFQFRRLIGALVREIAPFVAATMLVVVIVVVFESMVDFLR